LFCIAYVNNCGPARPLLAVYREVHTMEELACEHTAASFCAMMM